MSVFLTLATIVYNLCEDEEYEKQHLTKSEQYEVQLNALLKEERIIRSEVFQTAISINEEEYKQYIAQVMRILSSLSGILNETLDSGTEDERSHIVLLRRKTLLVVNRLIAFIQKRFPIVSTEAISAIKKRRLNYSVSAIAIFARAIVNETGLKDKGQQSDVMRFIIRHFSSIEQDEMAFDSFHKSYYNPEPVSIHQIIILLEKMIKFLKAL